jgi:hypothetical protein
MARPGVFGVGFAKSAWFVVLAFIACGGESATNQSGNGNGDDDAGSSGTSRGGAGNRGGASGDGAGGIAGTAGVGMSGSSFGGSYGGVEARGGTGAVDPIPPPGPSFCGGKPCDPPLACCLATGECFDPSTDSEACETPDPDSDPQGRKACASSAQCEPGEFCQLDSLTCLGTGHCQSIGNCGFCGADDTVPDNPCRVCACDGNTYPNFQTACLAGVNALNATGAGCGETATEGGAGSSSIGPKPVTPCGHDGQCPSGSFCCALAARCYPEADRDICVTPPPGTRIACNTTQDCSGLEYCKGEGCDGPGGCVAMGSAPGDCGVTFELVCGCDGVTYTSAACADQEGVRIDHEGECADLAE